MKESQRISSKEWQKNPERESLGSFLKIFSSFQFSDADAVEL